MYIFSTVYLGFNSIKQPPQQQQQQLQNNKKNKLPSTIKPRLIERAVTYLDKKI